MLGEYIECEADRTSKYYRVINTIKEYSDGRRFPLNEIVVADNKVNLNATDRKQIGGFYISTYEYIFRWLIRGDTLCEVIFPEDGKIYKTTSVNGIYVAEKIILTNPQKIDDDFATELYLNSKLPENSYFSAMTACSICGYTNTAMRVCKDKVSKENVDTAIFELDSFCARRNAERKSEDIKAKESVQVLRNHLLEIKNS